MSDSKSSRPSWLYDDVRPDWLYDEQGNRFDYLADPYELVVRRGFLSGQSV